MNIDKANIEKLNISDRIVLVSGSPRRKELLSYITDNFIVSPSDVEEVYPDDLGHREVAIYLSKIKLESKANDFPNDIIISADTIVVYKKKILGKPKDKREAREMLSILSGKIHEVVTAVSIKKGEIFKQFHDVTFVKFRSLSEDEIEEYINSDEPYDKAGGYGIQGNANKFVEYIDGDFYNVVGLPVSKLVSNIKSLYC